ncbi:FkbM family methyltransferase [Sulfurimonas hydrogeniphila]|uniref:FkbM family methyltransferase n=1 Tax=Sulfurimonas TaxID=202746 RepID=UPI00125ED5FC|nr:FkbM family methyltransferase [Sulfurimonas hydrogeniphila]
MSFVSYSQNLEDVMLHRALQNVKEGFYIDVGANDPLHDSVTKAFYDAGWQGINVEPEKKFFQRLQEKRVRDINLNYAVSAKMDEITFFVSDVRGRSTTNPDIAHAKNDNTFSQKPVTVKTVTIDDLVQQYAPKTIHFLKIDVEGAEEDVLQSVSFEKVRPWILLVEATLPGTNEDISSKWEHLIIQHNYTQVYFDGINKYYLANEKKELAKHFSSPPNILDDYIQYEHKRALQRAEYFSLKLQNEREAWEKTHNNLLQEINELKIREAELLNSKSWKITKPLRTFFSYFKKTSPALIQQTTQTQKEEKKTQNVYPKNFEQLNADAQNIYKELSCESS